MGSRTFQAHVLGLVALALTAMGAGEAGADPTARNLWGSDDGALVVKSAGTNKFGEMLWDVTFDRELTFRYYATVQKSGQLQMQARIVSKRQAGQTSKIIIIDGLGSSNAQLFQQTWSRSKAGAPPAISAGSPGKIYIGKWK